MTTPTKLEVLEAIKARLTDKKAPFSKLLNQAIERLKK